MKIAPPTTYQTTPCHITEDRSLRTASFSSKTKIRPRILQVLLLYDTPKHGPLFGSQQVLILNSLFILARCVPSEIRCLIHNVDLLRTHFTYVGVLVSYYIHACEFTYFVHVFYFSLMHFGCQLVFGPYAYLSTETLYQ
jgi:hypothetical protein